jgi:TPR repeat protein
MKTPGWAAVCLVAGACAATPVAPRAPNEPPGAAPGASSTAPSAAPLPAPSSPSPPPTAAPTDVPPTPGEKAVEQHFAPVAAACERGEAPACARLARRINYVTNNREGRRVATALAKGCAARVPVACGGYATSLARSGVAGDVARGVELLRATCAADEPFACGQLAEIEIKGEYGVTGRQAEGRRRAKDACDKHGGWPCMAAIAGLDQKKEGARMLALTQRACDGGDASACYLLGQVYSEGTPDLAKANPQRATELYQKGCDGDFAQACFNLAWQYLRGTGAPSDEGRGRAMLVRACTLGDPSGCDELARRDNKPRQYCELWGAQACYDLAVEVTQQRGETAEAAQDVLWAGDRACRRGHHGACNIMGHVAKDFVRWCAAGDKVRDTCTFAGLIHVMMASDPNATLNDRRRATDPARGELASACKAGSRPGCDAAARLPPQQTSP